MSDDQNLNSSTMPDPKTRPVGGTEYSWCRAVPCGTGITVLALLLSKPPNFPHLQNALHNIQNSHPILRSKHRFDSATNSFSFITPPTSNLQIQTFDLQSTAHILQAQSQSNSIAPFHLILEHEINTNTWRDQDPSSDSDVMFASVYTLSESRRVLALRLHTSACDRSAAVALLRELMAEMNSIGGVAGGELKGNAEVSLGIEDLVPNGKANKPFWARGVDMLGYSLNSLRLSNLEFKFKDANPARRSEVVKLLMDPQDTQKLLDGCKSREIKLCAALAAAGLIAARAAKNLPDHQWEKYAVVTLLDCRSTLDPPLPANHLGFYHSAITNTHDMNGGSTLWELAERCYTAFANAKNSNKHFTDMSDLNFLMVKAMENPGLTPSSSLRTALISVFENSVIDESSEVHQELGVEDYEGCASVHGVGPSIAIFDTIRDGGLNCACVYPSPLHSREQMQDLMDHMKNILIDGCSDVESEG